MCSFRTASLAAKGLLATEIGNPAPAPGNFAGPPRFRIFKPRRSPFSFDFAFRQERLNSQHFPTAAPRAAAGPHTDTLTGRAAVQSLLRQQPACTGPRGPRACRKRPHGAVLFPHPTDGQREDTFSRKAARARAARRYGRFRVAAKRSTWKLLLLRAAKGRAHGAEDVRAARQSPRQVRSWWKDFF